MSRQTGYTVTIKAFVESPKNDFEKQAAAAVLMATITKSKTIPPEFLELASVEDVSAKYGSRSVSVPAPEAPPADNEHVADGATPFPEPQSEETAVDAVKKAGRARG